MHLLTHLSSYQKDATEDIIRDTTFQGLCRLGLLSISSLPGVGAKDDNERYLNRTGLSQFVSYPRDNHFKSLIPIDAPMYVNELQESQNNTNAFLKFGQLIKLYRPDVYPVYVEILEDSEFEGIPFYHEHFVSRLRSELDKDLFDTVWRETNSIFITTGAPEWTDLATYFEPTYESLDYRFDARGNDRYLFNPLVLRLFCSIFVSTRSILELNSIDADSLKKDVLDQAGPELLRSFRAEYWNINLHVSRILQTLPPNELDDDTLLRAFEFFLSGEFSKRAEFGSGMLEDVSQIAKLADVETAGILATIGNKGIKYAKSSLRRWSLKKKYPAICEVMNIIENL